MATRPFQFGAKAVKAGSAKEWIDLVRRVEDLGYESFQMDDHFGNQLAVVPGLMAAACATEKLLVGPHVAGVDFRNPVLFAKECATIDVLSGGRFTLGIGAGWSKTDYATAGIHQDDASTRIERLAEAVTIMRGLWSEGSFAFEGRHYRVAEVDGMPTAVSDIPVMIGGGGRQILTLAAQQADIVGINPKIVARSINPESMRTAAADAVDEKVGWVREAAGERFDQLVLQMQIFKTTVTDRPAEVIEQVASAVGVPSDVIASAPFFQIGSIEQITENFLRMRERWGVSNILFQPDGIEPLAPVVAKLAGT